MEILGKGEPVPYERCVLASTGQPPSPSDPAAKRAPGGRAAGARRATRRAGDADLLAAVDAWRGARHVPMASVRSVGDAYIADYRALAERNLRPYLPRELGDVPMDNIEFLPIKDAWFSGSMNYLGRKRRPGGRPEYEATYEINASLQITVPEFEQLVTPRGGARPRHHLRLPAEPLLARAGRLRGLGADHEHPRRPRSSRASPTTPSSSRTASPSWSRSPTTTCRSACCWRCCRTTPRTRRRT